jgi:hypothetical protein
MGDSWQHVTCGRRSSGTATKGPTARQTAEGGAVRAHRDLYVFLRPHELTTGASASEPVAPSPRDFRFRL